MKIKINFYFNEYVVTALPLQLAEEFSEKLMSFILQNEDRLNKIEGNRGELDVHILYIGNIGNIFQTYVSPSNAKPDYFECVYFCMPDIFYIDATATVDSTSVIPTRVKAVGEIVQYKLQFNDIRSMDLFNDEIYAKPAEKVPEVVVEFDSQQIALTRLNENHQNSLFYSHRLPLELMPIIHNFTLKGKLQFNDLSISTRTMNDFTKAVDNEIKRLTDKNDTFSSDKAVALGEAKKRAIAAARKSKDLAISFTALYQHKQVGQPSVRDIAKWRGRPATDMFGQVGVLGLSMFKSSQKTQVKHDDLSIQEKCQVKRDLLKGQALTDTEINITIADFTIALERFGSEEKREKYKQLFWHYELAHEMRNLNQVSFTK